MRAYALELRERVVKFIQGGGSKSEAARRFDLARSSVYRYLAAAQTGALAPKKSWGHWRKLDPDKLQAHVKKHPDATLKNAAARRARLDDCRRNFTPPPWTPRDRLCVR